MECLPRRGCEFVCFNLCKNQWNYHSFEIKGIQSGKKESLCFYKRIRRQRDPIRNSNSRPFVTRNHVTIHGQYAFYSKLFSPVDDNVVMDENQVKSNYSSWNSCSNDLCLSNVRHQSYQHYDQSEHPSHSDETQRNDKSHLEEMQSCNKSILPPFSSQDQKEILNRMVLYLQDKSYISPKRAFNVFQKIYSELNEKELIKLLHNARKIITNTAHTISKDDRGMIKEFVEGYILRYDLQVKDTQEVSSGFNHNSKSKYDDQILSPTTQTIHLHHSLHSHTNFKFALVNQCVRELRKKLPFADRTKLYHAVLAEVNQWVKKSITNEEHQQIANIVKASLGIDNHVDICNKVESEFRIPFRSAVYMVVSQEMLKAERRQISNQTRNQVVFLVQEYLHNMEVPQANTTVSNESQLLASSSNVSISAICDYILKKDNSLKVSRSQLYEMVRSFIKKLESKLHNEKKHEMRSFISIRIRDFKHFEPKLFASICNEASEYFKVPKWIINQLMKDEYQRMERRTISKENTTIIMNFVRNNSTDDPIRITEELLQHVSLPKRAVYEIVKRTIKKINTESICDQTKNAILVIIEENKEQISSGSMAIPHICDIVTKSLPFTPRSALDYIIRHEVLKIQRKQITDGQRAIVKQFLQDVREEDYQNKEYRLQIMNELQAKLNISRALVKYLVDCERRNHQRKVTQNCKGTSKGVASE